MIWRFEQVKEKLQYLINEIFQIAEEYDSTKTYAVDDYCTYEGKILRCTSATSGAFDSSAWTDAVIVMDVIKAIKARLTAAESNISTAQSDISAAQSDISAAQEDITALNLSFSQFSNVLSGASACGLTAQTGVTISKCYKLKIGRLVAYNIQLSITTSAAAGSLIRGFELPAGTVNGMSSLIHPMNNSNSNDFFFYLSADNNGELRARAIPSSADLRFSMIYITAS